MKKILFLSLVLTLIFGVFFIPKSKSISPSEKALVIGTNAEYPPYTFISENSIVGFDIDVIKEVSKRLNMPIRIKDYSFDALIAELTLKKIDVIAAGMSPTQERAKRVSFTKPYVNEDSLVVVSLEEDSLLSAGDLIGKKVVVNEGYTAAIYAGQIKGLELVQLTRVSDAFLALKSKRVDAFITAKTTIDDFLRVQTDEKFHITPLQADSEGVSLAVNKENQNLLKSIQTALDEMEKDGTMRKIKEKWHIL